MIQKEKTKIVTLEFLRRELVDDVNSYAYVEGDVMSQDAGHAKHQTFDILQDGNRELCSRIIKLVLAKCREILYPFTKVGVENNEAHNDVLTEPEKYTISMEVPESFSQTTADYLEQLIHNLIVYRILFNWLSITKPESAAVWLTKADAVQGEIASAKSIRMKRIHRKISVFP